MSIGMPLMRRVNCTIVAAGLAGLVSCSPTTVAMTAPTTDGSCEGMIAEVERDCSGECLQDLASEIFERCHSRLVDMFDPHVDQKALPLLRVLAAKLDSEDIERLGSMEDGWFGLSLFGIRQERAAEALQALRSHPGKDSAVRLYQRSLPSGAWGSDINIVLGALEGPEARSLSERMLLEIEERFREDSVRSRLMIAELSWLSPWYDVGRLVDLLRASRDPAMTVQVLMTIMNNPCISDTAAVQVQAYVEGHWSSRLKEVFSEMKDEATDEACRLARRVEPAGETIERFIRVRERSSVEEWFVGYQESCARTQDLEAPLSSVVAMPPPPSRVRRAYEAVAIDGRVEGAKWFPLAGRRGLIVDGTTVIEARTTGTDVELEYIATLMFVDAVGVGKKGEIFLHSKRTYDVSHGAPLVKMLWVYDEFGLRPVGCNGDHTGSG